MYSKIQNEYEYVLPLTPYEWLYSNTRQFYLSKGDPLGLKGIKNYLP